MPDSSLHCKEEVMSSPAVIVGKNIYGFLISSTMPVVLSSVSKLFRWPSGSCDSMSARSSNTLESLFFLDMAPFVALVPFFWLNSM